MNATPTQLERASQARQPQPTFKCVVIYEDAAAGERGECFFQKLVEAVGGDCVAIHQLWSFPALAIPEMRNIAASAAAVADIVIFSLSGEETLPPKVKEWIQMWLLLIEGGNPALVPLFNRATGESAAIGSYLRSATSHKRLDCFPHCTPFASTQTTVPHSRRRLNE